MVRFTDLTGTVLATEGEDSGAGRKIAVVALLVAAIVLVLRRRGGDDDSIDRIDTDDEDDEEELESVDRIDTDDEDDDEEDDRSVAVEVEESGGRFDLDTTDLDLFDLVAVVGAAYRAARTEYESRRAETEAAEA